MGVFGPGLYSGDFALDLRSEFKAVARLPFDGDKLIDLLCSLQPTASNHPEDEEHTTFWLVVADQFAKSGIVCDQARQKALAIIDGESDLAMLAKLGMKSADLAKRKKMLAELRRSLTTAAKPAKPRSVLKSPQPLLMAVGDVFVYPTSRGRSKEDCPPGILVVPTWAQDGWGAAVIAAAGRAFDFLAWYCPLTLASPFSEKPDLEQLRSAPSWILRGPGTCTAVALKRLGFEKIGTLRVDGEKLKLSFPGMRSGTNAAIANRAISRELDMSSRVGETFISERALARTPEGRAKLPDLIRRAAESYEKLQAAHQKTAASRGPREPTISSLGEILS